MLTKNYLIGFYLLFITVLPVIAQKSTGNKQFDTLRSRFEKGELFQSQLNHLFIDSYTKDTTVTLGEIWIDKARYRLSTETGIIVVDGKTSHVFNPQKNQVIISTYNQEDDEYAPSRFLFGSLKEYVIRNGPTRNKNSTIIMTSDDPFALFTKVEIEFNEQAVPLRITAIDQSDNVIISRFSFGKFVTPSPQAFLLSYPKSAEVIDLRN